MSLIRFVSGSISRSYTLDITQEKILFSPPLSLSLSLIFLVCFYAGDYLRQHTYSSGDWFPYHDKRYPFSFILLCFVLISVTTSYVMLLCLKKKTGSYDNNRIKHRINSGGGEIQKKKLCCCFMSFLFLLDKKIK